MQNFRALGAPPPGPRASGGWGLCPRTPSLRRWELRLQTPIGIRRLGAPPPEPQNSPPIANFWLRACVSSQNYPTGLSFFVVVASAVATMRPGAPSTTNDCLCPPPFWFIQNAFLGSSRNDKTTGNNGKRNNNFQT